MQKVVRAVLLTNLLVVLTCTGSLAQDWRAPNPNQPNGYHASEAASHYHGNDHWPAQPQNGYHASEARSHYGGSRFEPSNGWDYQNNSGPGSAFSSEKVDSGGPGSAYSNASWHQNGGNENSLMERMHRSARWQQGFRNLAAAGYMPGATRSGGANGVGTTGGVPSFSNRFETFAPMMQREQQMRQRAIQNIEDGQGGFNRIYSD